MACFVGLPLLGALFLTSFTSSQSSPKPPIGSFAITPEQFWHTPFATDPRFPMAGDADGDGRADLISLWPQGPGVIDLARTSALGKPIYGNVALSNFGRDAIGAACGLFADKAADVVGVFADGTVRVAWGMAPGTNTYKHDDLAATIPAGSLPKAPLKTAVADFDGDGRADVLLLGEDGALMLLVNRTGADGAPRFAARPLKTRLDGVRRLAAGVVKGSAKGQAVWLDGSGEVHRAPVCLSDLAPATTVTKASPDDHLVVGRFRGAEVCDIVVGQRLLAGGDPNAETVMRGLPDPAVAKADGPWVAADIDGNGKDDLVRFRRGGERFTGQDTYVHFSYDSTEKAKGYYCTANDGLPDAWKLGLIKPGGLDLASMGCRVGRRDVIVQLERFENVDENNLKENMKRVAQFYEALPIKNPDGSSGIFCHFIYDKPIPLSEHDRVRDHFDDYFPPVEYRGILHTVIDENNGPLVSKVNGDNGRFNGDWRVFVHEFGHELDLGHEGFWGPGYCALYPSLMSYTYSYSLNDDGDQICYSDGSRASFVINELHLSERLPFPIEKVKFLSGGPYRFKIKASPDGKSTLVDWNWNGILGEEDVCADVNYSHGTDIGPGHPVVKSQTAPVLLNVGGKIVMLYGPAKGQGFRLCAKTWLGTNRDTEGDRWSEEMELEPGAATGDPTATVLNGTIWLAYGTAQGVSVRKVALDAAGKVSAGDPKLVTRSKDAQPTLAAVGDRMALLLWRGPALPVGVRVLDDAGNPGPEVDMPFDSEAPVAATAGPVWSDGSVLWVSYILTSGANEGRTEAVRCALGSDHRLRATDRKLLEGRYAKRRSTLLWQNEVGMQPTGRLYQIAGDSCATPTTLSPQVIAMNIPYADVGNGWLLRRYFQPDFTSASAGGACFSQGNIVYAIRRLDDMVSVFFYGNGATATPMGDFDDIGHIRDYGLSHSLREVPK